jgi:predicted peptidase
MTLVVERPVDLPPDLSRKQTVTFTSSTDGCEQTANIYSPAVETSGSLPLVLAPHPITWTAEDDYHGGLEGLMRKYHPGYYGLADKYQVIIAMPHGHHHKEELCSVAGPEQISDMNDLIDALEEFGYRVDKSRVYVSGISMGGQEALVLAGKYPDRITAVCVFNPIVDLAAWQEDLANSEVPEIREYGTADRIANEVGCYPDEMTEPYAERSATNYVDGLSKVPTLVYWSEQDLIVPRQISHHTYLLYKMVKDMSLTNPFAEFNHTRSHGISEFDQLTRWQLHEWCDYDLALHWLLTHKKF